MPMVLHELQGGGEPRTDAVCGNVLCVATCCDNMLCGSCNHGSLSLSAVTCWDWNAAPATDSNTRDVAQLKCGAGVGWVV